MGFFTKPPSELSDLFSPDEGKSVRAKLVRVKIVT